MAVRLTPCRRPHDLKKGEVTTLDDLVGNPNPLAGKASLAHAHRQCYGAWTFNGKETTRCDCSTATAIWTTKATSRTGTVLERSRRPVSWDSWWWGSTPRTGTQGDPAANSASASTPTTRHTARKRSWSTSAERGKVCAWGETGLDFNRMYSARDVQVIDSERQLEIAARLDLPLIFHERDSNGHFLEVLEPPAALPAVHCLGPTRKCLRILI